MGLKPEIIKHLAERAALGQPQVWQAPLDEIRKNTHTHIALTQPLIDLFAVEHKFIPGPTADLPIRIYRPTNEKNLPALVFFHGGGWVLNFLESVSGLLVRLNLRRAKRLVHRYLDIFNEVVHQRH